MSSSSSQLLPQSQFKLFDALIKNRDFKSAIAHGENLIKNCPKGRTCHPNVYHHLSWTYLMINQPKKALFYADDGLKITDKGTLEEVKLLSQKIEALRELTQFEQFKKTAARAINILHFLPDDNNKKFLLAEINQLFALVLFQEEDYKGAEEKARAGLAAKTQRKNYKRYLLNILVQALEHQKGKEESVAIFKEQLAEEMKQPLEKKYIDNK